MSRTPASHAKRMLTITEFNFAGFEEVDHVANLRPDAFKDGGIEDFSFVFFLRLAALTSSCLIRHWWGSRYFFGWLSIPSFTVAVHPKSIRSRAFNSHQHAMFVTPLNDIGTQGV